MALRPNYEDIVWSAGFFDGDGYVGINGKWYQVEVRVTQKSRQILESVFQKFWGGNIYELPSGVHQWKANCRIASEFLRDIAPFTKTKSEEVQAALRVQGRKRYGRRNDYKEDEQDRLICKESKRVKYQRAPCN